MNWTDITALSRGEKPVTRTVEAVVGPMRLVVTRRHGLDGWFADLSGLWNYRKLIATDLEAAKIEAVTMARVFLTDVQTALSK